MPYVKKLRTDDTPEQPTGLVSKVAAPVKLTEAAPVVAPKVTGGTVTPQGEDRPVSTTGYVSGSQYAAGNVGATQRLAERLYDPIKDIGVAGQTRLEEVGTQFAEQTAGGYQQDPDLVTLASTTPGQLTEEQQTQFEGMITGAYTGPEDIPEFTQVQEQEARIRALANMMGTSEGLLGQLPLDDDRKYTPGMQSFDVGMLQQSPAIKAQIAAQMLHADVLEQARYGAGFQAQSAIDAAKLAALQQAFGIQSTMSGAAGTMEADFLAQLEEARAAAAIRADEVADIVAAGGTLSPEILAEIGLTPEQMQELIGTPYEYSIFGHIFPAQDERLTTQRISGWKADPRTWTQRPFDYDPEQPFYSQVTPQTYTPVYEQFDWTPYMGTVDPSDIGYGTAIGAEDLARYQALTGLGGITGQAGIPSAISGADAISDLSQYDYDAAMAALQLFMAQQVPGQRGEGEIIGGPADVWWD